MCFPPSGLLGVGKTAARQKFVHLFGEELVLCVHVNLFIFSKILFTIRGFSVIQSPLNSLHHIFQLSLVQGRQVQH